MRKKNDFELKELVQTFMRQPAYKERLYLAKINIFWKNEMGRTIADSIQSLFLRKGKLYIGLESSVLRNELQASKLSILTKMNEVIGEDYIKEIIFR